MMILAGLCDLLDGPVARRQNRTSLFGGFLDSILDRYADLILFLGLLVYYAHVNRFLYAVLAGAAMAGAVMVSYAKARAESLVPRSEVGFWERPERLALMILGALTNRMDIALWVLAIGPNITVIHRIVQTWQQTKAGDVMSPAPVRTSLAENARGRAAQEAPMMTRSARGSR
jgi:CDP-diacylglycerol---glycerol-3-phosphate 3-phosphatidyltransferase